MTENETDNAWSYRMAEWGTENEVKFMGGTFQICLDIGYAEAYGVSTMHSLRHDYKAWEIESKKILAEGMIHTEWYTPSGWPARGVNKMR